MPYGMGWGFVRKYSAGNQSASMSAPAKAMIQRLRQFFFSGLPAYIVLLISLITTLAIWRIWLNYEKLQARQKHSQYINLEKDKINLRIHSFLENLYAIQAAAQSQGIVRNKQKWAAFARELGLFSRYNSVLSVNAYHYLPKKNIFRLLIETHKEGFVPLKQVHLSSEQKKRVQKALADNLPFAFIEDRNAKSPILHLFMHDTLKRKPGQKLFFSFQIHLPLLIEDLFGDRARQDPDPKGIAYTEVLSVNIAGARYNIYFLVDQAYAEEAFYVSTLFLFSGIIFSFLLFLILMALTRSRERALKLAHKMTEEYRKAKLEADRANSAKSDFLARMSHEIRTPLNAIIGVADLLRETPLTEEQERYIRLFSTSGEMLLSIINDVLDISKIESGRLDIEMIAFDLPELVEGLVALFSTKARKRGIELELKMELGAARFFLGDPTRIRQILVNLIGNAIKFTDQGSVRVSVKAEKHTYTAYYTVLFEVQDSGIGIPEDRLESIFESFTQVDASTTRKYGGTGLGLTISKKLARLMDGDIHVKNNPEGGASFTLALPLKQVEEIRTEAANHAQDFSKKKTDSFRYQILLAEDTPENAILIQAFLKNFPADITHVQNGKEALEAVQSGKPFDLILMDLQMPVMDGLTATQKIRDWENAHAKRPVVIAALTAHALSQYQEEGIKAGCTDFLSKPIRKKQLLEYLEKTLGKTPVPKASAQSAG